MQKNKMILFAIAGWLLVLVMFLMVFLWWSGWWNKKTTKWPKEFNVWVVGDETAWFSDVIKGFKDKNAEYKDTEIKFTKFSNYSDYEKILLNVMSDGNSPDIFVINNNSTSSEWEWLLDSKIIAIPDSAIWIDKFSKEFNKVFDELVIQNEEENKEWKKIKANYLKWIPLWYETMGLFYNSRKVDTVPSTWAELDTEIQNKAEAWYSTVWIWTWDKYTFNSSDIVSLLFLQNWIDNYKKIWDSNTENTIKWYKSYFTDTNNKLSDLLTAQIDNLKLTTVDHFVRWNIGILIGYPSLMKEIILAQKRTSWNSSLKAQFLRISPIPQINNWENKDKNKEWASWDKINLINYNFFAISKYTKNQEMGLKFATYLSTMEAQEKYIASFPYYLPALKALEDWRLKENLGEWFIRATYAPFLEKDVELKSFNKWLKTEYDKFISTHLDDNTDPSILSKNIKSYIECNVSHIIKWIDFDKDCEENK